MQLSRTGYLLLRDYASSHRTPGNKAFHYVGIPTIIIAILGLLREIPVPQLGLAYEWNWALLFLVSSGVWYALHYRIYAGPFLLLLIGLYYVATVNGLAVHLALFVMGWIFQLVGHSKYEKKSPSFLQNVTHLWVGPIFLFYSALGKIEEWNQSPLPPVPGP